MKIIVRRTNSLGDVLAATTVADALLDLGHEVGFQAHRNSHPLLRLHPRLKQILEPAGNPNINLDGAYEHHPERTTRHYFDIYREVANRELAKTNIVLPGINCAPRINLTPSQQVLNFCSRYPKPWVMIAPRSNSWINRTVPDQVWADAARLMNGTTFWIGNHGPAPAGIVDMKCKTVEELAACIAAADLVVTVDSGPMHIAAALRVPVVVLQQATASRLTLANQRDWVAVATDLDCLNCQLPQCPINASQPPCQNFPPETIATAVNLRLRSLPGSFTVSAVIAVYKPDVAKLNRCLAAVLPQVNEVIIVGDQDTPWPIDGLLRDDSKIICVRMPAKATGYGRKATFGARHANGEFLHQLNDDVYLGADAIQTLLNEMKPDVAIVTHTLRYLDGKIQYAGKYRPRGARGFGHLDYQAARSRFTSPVEQESACGASMMVRRAAFFEADCFDERYKLYAEDDSLALRIRQLGWKVIFTPLGKTSYHEEHQSVNITPGWRDLMAESNRKFAQQWRFYFDLNPNPMSLGRFRK